jgi:hypothetical protein
MCITADAGSNTADESIFLEAEKELKVVSVDVDKVGRIYSAVPGGVGGFKGVISGGNSGRVRLLNYFKYIQKKIDVEAASRKADIAALKAKMAVNRAFNAKARSQMKKMLLTKMAQNAKTAKDELAKAQAKTARTFHKQHVLNNKRWRRERRETKHLRKRMRKNKLQAAAELRKATQNQQTALAALDQKMNAHIAKTNKHIAANAAQIKINAKKAADELHKANQAFDKKLFDAKKEAAAGRSKLAAEAQSMDKKTRAIISGSVKAEAQKTAAEFAKVRGKMAEDRHHADMAIKHASQKMTAALHMTAALQDKEWAKMTSDIAKAKAEAAAMLKKAETGFKVNLLQLKSTVKEQVTELNGKVTQLQGTIAKNKLEQANVNRHVTAEMKRMVALGHTRENALAKKDKALHNLMKKNHGLNEAAMTRLANQFNTKLGEIQKQMAKDRAHHEHELNTMTTTLYDTLSKNEKAQGKVNKKLAAATARVKLDAEDALRKAKEDFGKRVASLTATVVANDKKADKKIKKLTGIVDANAAKDAEGRKALKVIQDNNKRELKTAIRNAVHKGEMRALQVEKHAKDMNTKTRSAMNMRITNEIGTLTKKIHGGIEDLRLNTKEARAAMKREILYSVRDAAAEAKANLATAVKMANKKMQALEDGLAKSKKESAAARGALKASIDSEKAKAERLIVDAVSTQNRALLALKTVTEKKIKKTNHAVNAYGERVVKHAKDVNAQIKANIKTLDGKITAAVDKVKGKITAANKASVDRKKAALKFIADSLKTAEVEADKKFGKLYIDLGKDRSHFDEKMAASATKLQEAIAKRSALYDSRFAKTVKNIKMAQDEALAAVLAERKAFTTSIVALNSAVKDQETRLTGEVKKVSTELQDNKVAQQIVNRKANAELKRILKESNNEHTAGRKARASIQKLFEEHKAIAAKERDSLAKATQTKLTKLRSTMASLRREAAEDLSKATKKLSGAVSKAQSEQDAEYTGLKGALAKAKLSTEAKLASSKKEFEAKLMTLTNVVDANNIKYEVGINKLTNVVHDWKLVSANERSLLKDQITAMEKDLNKAIVKAIDIGEAKARAVEERALEGANAAKKILSGEIAQQVEHMADDVFKAVLENRGKIADNYLALKAYAASKAGDIIDYTTKEGGKGLFSLGDLLTTVAALSSYHTKAAEGVGFGGGKVPPIFGGDLITVSTTLTKANGLVDEWTKAMSMVRTRWPIGIGHYLLGKVQYAMQNEGLLTIGSISRADGQFVYINAHTVGLSNKLPELEKLATKTVDYQHALKHLTAKLPKKKKVAKKPFYVPGQEWQGD